MYFFSILTLGNVVFWSYEIYNNSIFMEFFRIVQILICNLTIDKRDDNQGWRRIKSDYTGM